MMQPTRLTHEHGLVRLGDLVAKDDNDLSKGFRPLDGYLAGVPVSAFTYPLYRRRAILVLGHGGHGKGELCKLLTELYGAECMSSSRAALPHIWPILREVDHDYLSADDAYECRVDYRELWARLISLYNTPDKTALAREVLAQADVYDGMRCAEEFAASRHLFDYVVWVDAVARVGTVDPTLTISRDVADLVIDNNGTLDDLRGAAVRLGARLGVTS